MKLKKHDIGLIVAFCLTGIYFTATMHLKADELLQKFLYMTIWFSGAYSFYLNIKTDQLWGNTGGFKKREKFDGFLVIVQLVCFEFLWFSFEHQFLWFAVDMCILNITYISWDFAHNDMLETRTIGRTIIIFDFLGLGISISLALFSLALLVNNDPSTVKHRDMWMMLSSGILIYHSIVGFLISRTHFKNTPSVV